MIRNKIKCPLCGEQISKSNYTKHLRRHEKHPESFKEIRKDLVCKYCLKEFDNVRARSQHECRCSKNPNKLGPNEGFNKKGRKAWNKGLNKTICKSLAKTSGAIARLKEARKGFKHSPETRLKMKQNPKYGGLRRGSGKGKKGYYKGYYCDSTFELVWTIYCLDHNINFKRCSRSYSYEYHGEKHKYHPDYELADNTLVEIKGWHTDVVDLKIQAVTDTSIKILYKKDMEYMFNYVANNYSYEHLEDLYDK